MLVLTLLIGLPVLAGFLLSFLPSATDGFDFWGPVIAMLVAVTSMSVSGVFVFMSFRIDRGVKNETRETVRDVLINEMTDIFRRAGEDARDRFNDAKKSSDRELAALEVRIKDAGAYVDQQLRDAVLRIDQTKTSIDKQLQEAADNIDNLFRAEAGQLRDYFSGVHDLITALRNQILTARLSAQADGEGDHRDTEDRRVKLRWEAGPDPDSALLRWEYQLKESDGEYTNWRPIPGEAVHKREHVVDKLRQGKTYTFRVRVKSDDAAPSNEVTVALDDDADE